MILFGSAIVLVPVVPHLIAARIGGVTGDVMGAAILATETLLLALAGLVTVL
jgi:cobalamin synthase